MSDQQLRNVLNVLAILVFVLAASCEIESCDCVHGTLETKDKPYHGVVGVTIPHADEKPKLTPGPGTCDSYTKQCNYFPLVRIGLHNPTNRVVTADVHCSFFVGDWNAGKNKRTGVKVNPKISKYVELQFNIDVQSGPNTFGVKCETYFK